MGMLPFDQSESHLSKLACFRAEKLSVAIDAAIVPIDKFHGLPANPAIRPGTFGNTGQIRQFKIIIVV